MQHPEFFAEGGNGLSNVFRFHDPGGNGQTVCAEGKGQVTVVDGDAAHSHVGDGDGVQDLPIELRCKGNSVRFCGGFEEGSAAQIVGSASLCGDGTLHSFCRSTNDGSFSEQTSCI